MLPLTCKLKCDPLNIAVAGVGPRLWNSLPVQLRNPDITYGLFRLLKGHFFGKHENGALWLLIRDALEKKHLLTYLLRHSEGEDDNDDDMVDSCDDRMWLIEVSEVYYQQAANGVACAALVVVNSIFSQHPHRHVRDADTLPLINLHLLIRKLCGRRNLSKTDEP